MIADEGWAKGHERPFLPSVQAAVKNPAGQRKPRSWPQIVLIIYRRPLEQCARRSNESVLIRIVHLPLVIVIENEFIRPPIERLITNVRRDEPFFRQQIVQRPRISSDVRIARIAYC